MVSGRKWVIGTFIFPLALVVASALTSYGLWGFFVTPPNFASHLHGANIEAYSDFYFKSGVLIRLENDDLAKRVAAAIRKRGSVGEPVLDYLVEAGIALENLPAVETDLIQSLVAQYAQFLKSKVSLGRILTYEKDGSKYVMLRLRADLKCCGLDLPAQYNGYVFVRQRDIFQIADSYSYLREGDLEFPEFRHFIVFYALLFLAVWGLWWIARTLKKDWLDPAKPHDSRSNP
jgi:hypothetical protein